MGTKDDENATSVASARDVEEPGSWPESARAWETSIKVRWVIDDLCLCNNCTIKVVLAQPGDELRDLVACEATNVEVDETKPRQGAWWGHPWRPPAGGPGAW